MKSPFNKTFMAKSPLEENKKPKKPMGNFDRGLKEASSTSDPKSYLKDVVYKYAKTEGQKAALNKAIESYD
mgnify:CR=1 FL=1|tara:strand:+ start:86 stop:298 length:213 start_codon:yes stop_codon:yes gene_type:complete